MTTISIIDISKHQANQKTYLNLIDFEALRKQNINDVYIKATEGGSYQDPAFLSHVKAAAAAGMRIGLYHFFRVRRSAGEQADNLVKAMQQAKAEAPASIFLPPMIDLEPVMQNKNGVMIDVDGIKDMAKGEYATAALSLADHVCGIIGEAPLAYTYPGFAQQVSLGVTLGHLPLWIAHYGVKRPSIPKGWQVAAVWQKTGTGKLKGVPTLVDINDLNVEAFTSAYPRLSGKLV